jgi:protein TonB
MRVRTVISCSAIALLAGACSKDTANVAAPGTPPVSSNVILDPGKHQQLLPIVQASDFVWSLPDGADGGFITRHGLYFAPLRPPSRSPIRVTATSGPFTQEWAVQLTSQPALPRDCLGERQAAIPFGSYFYVDELPEAIVRVSPVYPDLAREAGVDGTVMVQARVCACGEVDSTSVVKSIPMLDSAAVTAVRRWIFKPALTAGEPVAVWVGIPVKFSLH